MFKEEEEIKKQAPEPPKKVRKKVVEKYVLTEVPTQTAPAIMNTETEEVIDMNNVLVKIMNDLEELKEILL